jgi:hypothetical protein
MGILPVKHGLEARATHKERNTVNIKPKFLATAIGSLPHGDPAVAVDVVLKSIPDAPIWPQLPATGLTEQMEIQYSEGMPAAVIEHDKRRMYFDTAADSSEARRPRQYMILGSRERHGDCRPRRSPRLSKGILPERPEAKGSRRS